MPVLTIGYKSNPEDARVSAYQPINCEFHDVLEACATSRKQVTLVIALPDGEVDTKSDFIHDIFCKNGAEYLQTGSGTIVRLDHVVSVDGIDIAAIETLSGTPHRHRR